jgi:1,4-alpha-glucan branching enzyme
MLKKKFFNTKDEAEVTFEYSANDINTVSLVADFNQWQPVDMKYNKKDKVFRTKVRLPRDSTFCFKYLLDNQEWDNDHDADAYIANPFGGDNSIVYTQSA